MHIITRSFFAISLTSLLSACGFGVVDKNYQFPTAEEGALIVYYHPEGLTAWFRKTDLNSNTFTGKGFTISDPNINIGKHLLWYQDERNSGTSIQIFFRDQNGESHYFSDQYRGFTFKVVPSGDFALTNQYLNRTGEWACYAAGASVYRIEPGKANLIVGEIQRQVPDEIINNLPDPADITSDVKFLLKELKRLDSENRLNLGSVTMEQEQLVLAELKKILQTYPNFTSEAVLSPKIKDITFKGRNDMWVGGKCPSNSESAFAIIDGK